MRVQRKLDSLENWLTNVGLVLLFVMSVIITANVVGRYFLNRPLPGTVTFVELFLMPGIVFLSAAYLQRDEGNIDVDILARKFRPVTRAVRDLIVWSGTLVIVAAMAYMIGQRALFAWQRGQWTGGAIQFPTYVSFLIASIGLALFTIRLVIQVWHILRELVEMIRTGNEPDW